MEPLRLELAFLLWESSSQILLSSPLCLLSWLVSSVSMDSSLLSSFCRKVTLTKLITMLIVTEPENYTMYMGYKHFASGICCGFSSLVSFLISESWNRLLVLPSVSSETRVWEPMQLNLKCLSEWSWFLFSQKLSVFTDSSLLSFFHRVDGLSASYHY